MFKSKTKLTCSYCSCIFKDPILLPCEDNICREHLSERDVQKENKIKCKKCNAEFQIKDNQFKSNEDLKNLIIHIQAKKKKVKTKESSYIFGGFASNSWDPPARYLKWKPDPYAFIFSLTNKDNQPLKIKSNPYYPQDAIYCDSEFGPTFGGGYDLCIANNANTTMDSHSRLGSDYIHPHYEAETNEAETFLAGSINFQLDEIEVYQKEE